MREFRPGVDCRRRLDAKSAHRFCLVPGRCGGAHRPDPLLPAGRAMGAQEPGRGRHGRREAERRRGVHEVARNGSRRGATSRTRKSSTWASCSRRCRPSAAAANGLIIRRGYIVAEFGDTLRPDPTYSVAKSMLVDRRRHRPRSRADSEPRQPGRGRREGRRIRFAAEQPRDVAPPPSAGIGVGRRDVGQERQLHRTRGIRRAPR